MESLAVVLKTCHMEVALLAEIARKLDMTIDELSYQVS